jgi:hypothetical protein
MKFISHAVNQIHNYIQQKPPFIHTQSFYESVNRILPFILGDPVAKHGRDTQYKSVTISLQYQGEAVERHAFINNMNIYKN